MSKYTAKNINCSLHLHIGNIPVNEKFLVNFWKVCKLLEKDIFALFPVAMKNTSKYKGRDYCCPLPPVAVNPEGIVNWISGREGYYEEYFKGLGERCHPNDQDNNRKWNVEQRYLWMNLVPYIFSERGTVEFRIHTASTNATKLINWLFICSGIVNFVKNYVASYDNDSLKKISLKSILRVVYGKYPQVCDYLDKYIDFRIQYMIQSAESGDEIGNIELMNDLNFQFKFNGRETLVSNEWP